MKPLNPAPLPVRKLSLLAFTLVALVAAGRTWADEPIDLVQDTKLYFTAPLRWDRQDWLFFGSAVAAIGVAHRYDTDVQTHFIVNNPSLLTDNSSHSLADAAPAAIAVIGTWAYAKLQDDANGNREAWTMVEAATLGSATGFALKFVAGRERPTDTTDPNSWRAGGDSFPSLHATAAFAIGTVLAESGSDEYRWVRRVLGYGIGVVTSHERLKHNQHWLSDTVAGAALGISSARFAMDRRDGRQRESNLTVLPTDGGLMLAYSVALH